MDLGDVTTLIGFAGGLAVLVSFAGAALGRLAAHSATYHAMNLTGGLALLAAGLAADAWPSVAVNGSWALVSAHGLARALTPPRPLREPLTDEHPVADEQDQEQLRRLGLPVAHLGKVASMSIEGSPRHTG